MTGVAGTGTVVGVVTNRAQVRRDGVEGADDEGQPGDRETGAGDRSGQPAQLGQGATVDPDQDGGNEDDDDDDVEQVHRREG